jgi:hypothetical protein
MLHWDLREGLAQERVEHLAAAMRNDGPGRARRTAGRLLIAAGEQLAAECRSQPRRRRRLRAV